MGLSNADVVSTPFGPDPDPTPSYEPTSGGLGCTVKVVLGPKSEPKLLQVYQRKDVKPKKQQVTSSGEGSIIIKADSREVISFGQKRDAILSKSMPIESQATLLPGRGAIDCWCHG